jgi:hypothetical protein
MINLLTKKKGYDICKILKKKNIEIIKKEIKKIFNFQGSYKELNNYIIELYDKNPIYAGKCYDMLNQSIAIQNIFLKKPILSIIMKYFKLYSKKQYLAYSDYQFLIILPNSKKEHLGWHQDSGYFKNSENPGNSLICWTSLSLFSDKVSGSLELLEGSHLNGIVSHAKNDPRIRKKVNLNKRGSVFINQRIVASYTKKNINIKSGSSLIFDANVIHRTGEQKISKHGIRFTLIARYKNILSVLSTEK